MDASALTLAAASRLLARGELSSLELTQAVITRIEQFNGRLNAYITVDGEGALAAARQADDQRQRGEATPLTGLPIALKDIFCTQNLKTTCGSRMLAHFIPPYESTVSQRLAAAGAVIVGKTNMDEFAMGSSNETSWFGPVANPWDESHIPGGSSGGSAAAVAADLCLAATGTDTGGSIRQPAALCGITGLKPTYGRVSRYGMIAFASSLDQGGPMTKSVEDAAMMLQVMAGHDPRDATAIPQPVPDYLAQLAQPVAGMRLGIPKEYFIAGLQPEVKAAVEQAMQVFHRLGITTVPVSLPHTDYAVPTYYIIASAEASSNLARYDGVRFSHRCQDTKDLADLYFRSRAEGFGPEVKRRIMLGTYVLSSGYYDAYYRKAQKVRRLIADDFAAAFSQVDAVLTPTSPTTAFKVGERTADPVQMYLSDIFTIGVNLAGLPALSLPCGLDDQGLPIGMQLIGPPLGESPLLCLGHAFQQATDWHLRKPALS